MPMVAFINSLLVIVGLILLAVLLLGRHIQAQPM
jgi:hypothetical protein